MQIFTNIFCFFAFLFFFIFSSSVHHLLHLPRFPMHRCRHCFGLVSQRCRKSWLLKNYFLCITWVEFKIIVMSHSRGLLLLPICFKHGLVGHGFKRFSGQLLDMVDKSKVFNWHIGKVFLNFAKHCFVLNQLSSTKLYCRSIQLSKIEYNFKIV